MTKHDTLKLCRQIQDELKTEYKMLNTWRFGFMRHQKVLGYCSWHYRLIQINKAFAKVNSEETIREVILHELAHAIVGKEHGHNDTFLETLKNIGAKDPQITMPVEKIVLWY